MGDTTKEGRVIPLFSSPTHSNKKSASKQPNGSQLFRQVMGYVRKRAQKRHIGWTLIPALITLRIVSTDNMKAIRAAFEKGPSNENPVPPDLLSDFLEMRRYFTAAIIFTAAENGIPQTKKKARSLEDILETLQDISDNNAWDWVSFHENEFEFFAEIAELSKLMTARFVLNRIKYDYLDSVLAFNKNFWNMRNAVEVYRRVVDFISTGKAQAAENEILQFFTKNDQAILQYYASAIQTNGDEWDYSPSPSLRPVYASNVPALSDFTIARAVRMAFQEDRAEADVTTNAIFTEPQQARGRIFVKEECVLCGVPLVEEAFRHFDRSFQLKIVKHDGEKIKAGDTIMELEGDIRVILRAERVALNYLALLSSIATRTQQMVELVRPYGVQVLDTRKTIPQLRVLSKYAVIKGGGLNHRHTLAEMGLIKDNHIAQAGSVTAAIHAFRKHAPFTPLELEVDTLEQLKEALPLKPDMVLLDNMNSKTMQEAMQLIRAANKKMGTKITAEASGGFTLTSAERLKDTGVDFVSLGAITNTILPPDFSLEII